MAVGEDATSFFSGMSGARLTSPVREGWGVDILAPGAGRSIPLEKAFRRGCLYEGTIGRRPGAYSCRTAVKSARRQCQEWAAPRAGGPPGCGKPVARRQGPQASPSGLSEPPRWPCRGPTWRPGGKTGVLVMLVPVSLST